MGPLLLHNTLSRSKEAFTPTDGRTVHLYCCGPTVYNFAHIGNLRTYIFEDLLHRVLLRHGWGVTHVMNITDVGHMTSDGDAGEDKMGVAAKREGKTPWEIARHYEEIFFRDSARLNIIKPDIAPRATEHVDGMIKLIQQLEAKGYTYVTPEGVYFDTSKDSDYGKLAGLNLADQKAAARDDLNIDPDKRHPADFILWFTNKPSHIMKWESPWGVGYPGWHIECSAMSMQYLGKTLDIHCGGTDHIPVHNTNEIAQRECATDAQFARFWLHGAFLIVEKGKMSKSSGEFLKVDTLIENGYDPLAYRYLCLTAHYRSALKSTWEPLDAATTALAKICELKSRQTGGDGLTDEQLAEARATVLEALNADLNLPRAVAALQEAKSYRLWAEFDDVLGLDIDKRSRAADDDGVPADVAALMAERDAVRKAKNWAASDDLRNRIEAMGYTVGDSPTGTTVKKKLL